MGGGGGGKPSSAPDLFEASLGEDSDIAQLQVKHPEFAHLTSPGWVAIQNLLCAMQRRDSNSGGGGGRGG